jgi:acetyltransferase-like isoleucine patch superfamily enzyme
MRTDTGAAPVTVNPPERFALAARAPGAVRALYAVRRTWYRLRYRRLTLGAGVQIRGRIRLRRGVTVTIGDRCRINKHVRFAGTGRVTVGPDTLLNDSWIGCWSTVTVGARCLLSDCQIVDNDFHHVDPARRHDPPDASTRSPISIGDNVWIGSNAMVLKGVSIAGDSVVGAACVVRTDVPARCVVIGNPQQVVKRFDV